MPLDVLADLRHDGDELVQWRVRMNERWLETHPEDAEPWRDDPNRPIQFRLSDDERGVLRKGLSQWARSS